MARCSGILITDIKVLLRNKLSSQKQPFLYPKIQTILKIATDCVIYFLKKFTLAVQLNYTCDCVLCVHDMSARISSLILHFTDTNNYVKRKRGDHI